MTKLDDLMSKGYQIQISDLVQPGTHVTYDTEEAVVISVNPWDYPYLAYDNPFEAHVVNMSKIYTNIEKRAEEALERLDKMVDQMNRKHDPRVVSFFPNVEVTENEDGSFSFNALPYMGDSNARQLIFDNKGRSLEQQGELFDEYHKHYEQALGWVRDSEVERSTYRSGQNDKPTFDELLSGESYNDDEEDPYLTFDEYMNGEQHDKTD